MMLLITLLCSCAGEKPVSAAGYYFDTAVTVTAWGMDEAGAQSLIDSCAEWESLLSKTREGSDVWRINNSDGAEVYVDGSTRELIELSAEVGGLSDGAFDITVETCARLWDFKNGVVPDGDELAEALKHVGYQDITLGEGVTLKKGMSIDLGGVAKGYIADGLAEEAGKAGASAAIINVGGDVAVYGAKPDGSLWNIGIRDPEGGAGDIKVRINTDGKAVVTSGTYERCFIKDGVLYHHILDPGTGMSAVSGLASATVICDSAARADALSTACIVMGSERAAEMIEGIEDTEAVFITDGGSVICTRGAEEMLIYD